MSNASRGVHSPTARGSNCAPKTHRPTPLLCRMSSLHAARLNERYQLKELIHV